MSDGKFFDKPAVDLSVEDRLSLLEAKIPSYQDRIAAYDKMLEASEQLKTTVSGLGGLIDAHKSILDALGSSVADLHNSQVARISSLKDEVAKSASNAELKFKEIVDSISGLVSQLSVVKSDLSSLKTSHDSVLVNAASGSDVDSLEKKIETQETAISSKLSDHKSFTSKAIEGIKSIIQEVKEEMVTTTSHADDYSVLFTKIADLKSEMSKISSEFEIRISNSLSQVGQTIDSKISAVTSKPSDIVEFKNDVSKKLETMGLDANSANIRSQNSDQKVFLIEKKLENISLLLKKLELTK